MKILHCFFPGSDNMVLSLHRICPFISSTFASLIRFLSASLCCSCSSAICCAFDYCCGVLGLLGVAAAGNRCAGVDIMFLWDGLIQSTKLAIICFGMDYAKTIAIFAVKLASLYRMRSAVADLWKYLSVFIDDYVYGGSSWWRSCVTACWCVCVSFLTSVPIWCKTELVTTQ